MGSRRPYSYYTHGVSLYAYIIVRRYFGSPGWVNLSVSERRLDVTVFFLLLEHLLYRGFGDRYLLGFLPFVLISVGQHLGNRLIRWNRVVVIGCLTMLIVSAMWTRGRPVDRSRSLVAGRRICSVSWHTPGTFADPPSGTSIMARLMITWQKLVTQ